MNLTKILFFISLIVFNRSESVSFRKKMQSDLVFNVYKEIVPLDQFEKILSQNIKFKIELSNKEIWETIIRFSFFSKFLPYNNNYLLIFLKKVRNHKINMIDYIIPCVIKFINKYTLAVATGNDVRISQDELKLDLNTTFQDFIDHVEKLETKPQNLELPWYQKSLFSHFDNLISSN